MRLRQLGSCGLAVSELGLGTMTWARDTDEYEAREQLELFLAAGGNLIDTADAYGNGKAQELVGALLHDVAADDVRVLSRSGGRADAARPFDHSRRNLLTSLETSLRRLGREAVDLWHIQGVDAHTPLDEICATLSDAISSGKVQYVGLTDWPAAQVGYVSAQLRGVHHREVAGSQYEYSLLQRGVERDLAAFVEQQGVGLIAWAPLGRGVLTGKYRAGTPADSRGASSHLRSFVEPYLNLRARRIVDAVCAAADGLGVAPADIALAWTLERPCVASAVIGARTAAQLRGILNGLGTELPSEISVALDDVSAEPAAYPHRNWW